MKIVLEPNLYILNSDNIGNEEAEMRHYLYFNKVLSFIDLYKISPIICTDLFHAEIKSKR